MASEDGFKSETAERPMSHNNSEFTSLKIEIAKKSPAKNPKSKKTAKKCWNSGLEKSVETPDVRFSSDVLHENIETSIPVDGKNPVNGKKQGESSKLLRKSNSHLDKKPREPFSDATNRNELLQSSIPVHDQKRKNGKIQVSEKFPNKNIQNTNLSSQQESNEQYSFYPPQDINPRYRLHPLQYFNQQYSLYHPQDSSQQYGLYPPQFINQRYRFYPPQNINQHYRLYPPQHINQRNSWFPQQVSNQRFNFVSHYGSNQYMNTFPQRDTNQHTSSLTQQGNRTANHQILNQLSIKEGKPSNNNSTTLIPISEPASVSSTQPKPFFGKQNGDAANMKIFPNTKSENVQKKSTSLKLEESSAFRNKCAKPDQLFKSILFRGIGCGSNKQTNFASDLESEEVTNHRKDFGSNLASLETINQQKAFGSNVINPCVIDQQGNDGFNVPSQRTTNQQTAVGNNSTSHCDSNQPFNLECDIKSQYDTSQFTGSIPYQENEQDIIHQAELLNSKQDIGSLISCLDIKDKDFSQSQFEKNIVVLLDQAHQETPDLTVDNSSTGNGNIKIASHDSGLDLKQASSNPPRQNSSLNLQLETKYNKPLNSKQFAKRKQEKIANLLSKFASTHQTLNVKNESLNQVSNASTIHDVNSHSDPLSNLEIIHNTNISRNASFDLSNSEVITMNQPLSLVPDTSNIRHVDCQQLNPSQLETDDSNLLKNSSSDTRNNILSEINKLLNQDHNSKTISDSCMYQNLLSNSGVTNDANLVYSSSTDEKFGYDENGNSNIPINNECLNKMWSLWNIKKEKHSTNHYSNSIQNTLAEFDKHIRFVQNRKNKNLSGQSYENKKTLPSSKNIEKDKYWSNIPPEISLKTWKAKFKHVNVFVAGPKDCGQYQLIRALIGQNLRPPLAGGCVPVASKIYLKPKVLLKIWLAYDFPKCIMCINSSDLKCFLLLVYSIADRQTLTSIHKYILDVEGQVSKTVPMILVGNGVDLRSTMTVDEDTKVKMNINLYQDGLKVKHAFDLQGFFECSGLTSKNVSLLFQYVADQASNSYPKNKKLGFF